MKTVLKLTVLTAAMAVSSFSVAETVTGTGEVTATAAPLTLEEIRPFTMEMVQKPGADMTTGFSLDASEVLNYLSEDPINSIVQGCVKVTGPANTSLLVAVTGISDLAAPEASVMAPNATSVTVTRSNDGCDSPDGAGADVGASATTGPGTASYETDAAGEAYLVWKYDIRSMSVGAWEEGIYTGTVDFEITPQE